MPLPWGTWVGHVRPINNNTLSIYLSIHLTVSLSHVCVLIPQATGLHFRHTDNVIQWLNAMSAKGLPKVSGIMGNVRGKTSGSHPPNSSHNRCRSLGSVNKEKLETF